MINPDYIRKDNQRKQVVLFVRTFEFEGLSYRDLYHFYVVHCNKRIEFRRFMRMSYDYMRKHPRVFLFDKNDLITKRSQKKHFYKVDDIVHGVDASGRDTSTNE